MKSPYAICISIICLLTACAEHEGFESLVKTSEESPGANCSGGGIKIQSGIDRDKNGNLDQYEVDNESFVCNGQDNSDRLTILSFGYSLGWDADTWTYPNHFGITLQDFNVHNYSNVDSVIFTAPLGTLVAENSCYLELFNVTDSLPITGSLIESKHLVQKPNYYKYERSGNIANAFPGKRIELGVRLRSEHNMMSVGTGSMFYLLIYKH